MVVDSGLKAQDNLHSILDKKGQERIGEKFRNEVVRVVVTNDDECNCCITNKSYRMCSILVVLRPTASQWNPIEVRDGMSKIRLPSKT